MAEIACLQQREKYVYAKSREELLKDITNAIKTENIILLSQLALCRFLIGVYESDIGRIENPYEIMPKLAKFVKGVRWSAKVTPDSSLAGKKGKYEYYLLFQHSPQGWTWTGLAATEPAMMTWPK